MDVEHNSIISGPNILPAKNDDPETPGLTHNLLGYSRNINATTPMDLSNFHIINDTTFYTIWDDELIDVHKDIHPEYFEIANSNFNITLNNQNIEGIAIRLKT
jgi:hypothetical protein